MRNKMERDWKINFDGNAPVHEAIRKLQDKVLQHDYMLHGYEEGYEDRHQDNDDDLVQKRYYYVLRGKYNYEKKTFFRGFVKDHVAYCEQSEGTWNFVGNSTTHAEKMLDWMELNEPIVEAQNATYHDDQGRFSKQWYTIEDTERNVRWIVPTAEEGNGIMCGRSNAIRKKHGSYVAAKRYLATKYGDGNH